MSLHPEWFTGDDFVMVHPAAVAHLDGDVLAVYVLARLRYRARVFGYDRDGRRWWRVSAQVLADDLGLTVDRVRRVLRGLLARGVVTAEKHHERGNYDHTQSYALVYENPGTTDVAESPHRTGEIAHSDVAESPNQDVAIPPHLPIRSEEREETPEPLAPLAESVDNSFEEFWNAYPRRVGKQAARRAFTRAIHSTDPDTIVAGARAYAASKLPDLQYVPYPRSWLDAGCWDDDHGATSRPSVPDVGPGDERCQVYGHDSYSATNCAGCRADALAGERSA